MYIDARVKSEPLLARRVRRLQYVSETACAALLRRHAAFNWRTAVRAAMKPPATALSRPLPDR